MPLFISRRFAAFAADTDAKRQDRVELRLTQPVTGWSVYSGDCWAAPLSVVWDSIARDVVGARTTEAPALTRVETIAECVATANTYYYDPDIVVGPARWDDPDTDYESDDYWDQTPFLYVHLANSMSPKDTVVTAEVGFYFASYAETAPVLGSDLLVDGAVEQWTSPTNLTYWSEGASGAGYAFGRSTDAAVGTYCVQLTGGGSKSGTAVFWQDSSHTFVVGKWYRYSGLFRTTAAGLWIAIRDSATATMGMLEDGRTYDTYGKVALPSSSGEWWRFAFDFIAPATGLRIMAMVAEDAVAGGIAYVDDLALRRVWRRPRYEARLSKVAVPAVVTGGTSIVPGSKQVGGGTLVINSEGLDGAFSSLDLAGASVVVDRGGEFSDGTMLVTESFVRAFTATVQKASGGDLDVSLQLRDVRADFHRKLPENVFIAGWTQVDSRFVGQPRRIWFGAKNNLTPVRSDISLTTRYGVYELADTTYLALKVVSAVYSYLDSDAAKNIDTSRRVTLVSGTDYTTSLTAGTVTMISDPQVIEITQDNNKLDFNDGAVKLAVVVAGMYIPRTLAAAIQTALNAVSSGWTVTYSETTHKLVIQKGSGTATLKCQTGANRDKSIWTEIGYSTSADKSGSLIYESDEVIYDTSTTDGLDRLEIRVDGQGYADDASGTYTGTPSALIQLGPDILKALLLLWMKKPSWVVGASLAASRTSTFVQEELACYVKQEVGTDKLFEAIENSTFSDIVIGGDGVVEFVPYAASLPSSIPLLEGEDLSNFTTDLDNEDIAREIRVQYDEDPSLGTFPSRIAEVSGAISRFGRREDKKFLTWITDQDNAQRLANAYALQMSEARRRFRFTVVGHLADAKVGDIRKISRDPCMGGALSEHVVRLLQLRQDRFITTVLAATWVDLS